MLLEGEINLVLVLAILALAGFALAVLGFALAARASQRHRDAALALENAEDRGNVPGVAADTGRKSGRQHPRDVLQQPPAGDVGEAVDPSRLDQRKLSPFARSTPARSTSRSARKLRAPAGKSSPITPTTCTGQKDEAAAAKNVAEPPRASSARPKGVSTVSSAMLPTTRSDIERRTG